MTRLTDQAQDVIATVLQTGEIAIDATAGNGHDSLFLCQTVGPTGKVYVLDIQQEALNQTTRRLQADDHNNFQTLCCNHSQLMTVTPIDNHQQIGAIMFNLGYLPGGDHSITTQRESTLASIRSSLEILRPEGILTILAYPGHDGGVEETQAVSELLSHLEKNEFLTEVFLSQSESASAPRLFVVRKN